LPTIETDGNIATKSNPEQIRKQDENRGKLDYGEDQLRSFEKDGGKDRLRLKWREIVGGFCHVGRYSPIIQQDPGIN
jgi:hypothetical protein